MEQQIFEFFQENGEVERFFSGLPYELKGVMIGEAEATPHTKPYRQYLDLIMQ